MDILLISLYLASIITDASGDALNNTNKKGIGHIFAMLSVGILLTMPFLVDFDIPKWYSYMFIYAFLRFAIFDVVWNLVAGQKWNYIGITSFMDKFFQKYPWWMKTFAQIIALIVALCI